MTTFRLRCTECGRESPEGPRALTCPDCAALQEPGGPVRGILEVVLQEPPGEWPSFDPADPRFLSVFLPVREAGSFPSFPAGCTPLVPAKRLGAELGLERLWVKDDTRNPSGSTKDRASLLVAAKAREYGLDTVAAASTGNAGTALAAVAAAAALRAVVFVPATAPEAKLVQMLAYGAEVLPVDGTYDQAFELCLEACREFGWYNRNTGLNPYTIEGKKTSAIEIAFDLGSRGPDVVVVPVGDGVILSGVAKGFADLAGSGLIADVPRLIAVQPEGSAAISTAWERGTEDVSPVPGAHSVADSLTVEAPRAARLCLRRIRETDGGAVTVTDDEILAAIPDLARSTGVFAEPAAAAALAGLRTALARGMVRASDEVVLLVTGSGLKDVPAAAGAVRRPEPIDPTLDAVAARLGS